MKFSTSVANGWNDARLRKGERTRLKLKAAAAALLEEDGYADLRQSDIADQAGVSSGTFYLYFKDKKEITSEVLMDFLEFSSQQLDTGERRNDPYETIRATHLSFLRLSEANSGMLRCLLQLSDDEPDFNEVRLRFGGEWYEMVANNVARRLGGHTVDSQTILMAVHCLGQMMDEVVRRLYVSKDAGFLSVSKVVTPTSEDLADFLALIWFRTLYGREPDRVSSKGAQRLSDLSRVALTPRHQ